MKTKTSSDLLRERKRRKADQNQGILSIDIFLPKITLKAIFVAKLKQILIRKRREIK